MTKHAGGRPPLYTNKEELEAAIEEYFDFCDNRVQQVYSKKADAILEIINPEPYTMAGLAYYLHMDRDTLLRYSKKKQFYGTIKAARNRVQMDVERRLMEGQPTGAIFNLKNNFGYKDVSQQDGTQKVIVETRKHSKSAPVDLDEGDDESDNAED